MLEGITPCPISLNAHAAGWATDLALSISVNSCMVSLEAAELLQGCTLSTVTTFRDSLGPACKRWFGSSHPSSSGA